MTLCPLNPSGTGQHEFVFGEKKQIPSCTGTHHTGCLFCLRGYFAEMLWQRSTTTTPPTKSIKKEDGDTNEHDNKDARRHSHIHCWDACATTNKWRCGSTLAGGKRCPATRDLTAVELKSVVRFLRPRTSREDILVCTAATPHSCYMYKTDDGKGPSKECVLVPWKASEPIYYAIVQVNEKNRSIQLSCEDWCSWFRLDDCPNWSSIMIPASKYFARS